VSAPLAAVSPLVARLWSARAMPKSSSLQDPELVMITFDGLMSL
jgi:hypothetical protein